MRERIGITRKVDDCGRIVIPKEIREQLNINIGENLEISMVKILKDKKNKEYVIEIRKIEEKQ